MIVVVKPAKNKNYRRMRSRPRVRDPYTPGVSTVHKLIAELEGGPFYTVAEIASMCDRSPATIKRWIRDELIEGPSRPEMVGKISVFLYTKDDAKRFKDFSKSLDNKNVT